MMITLGFSLILITFTFGSEFKEVCPVNEHYTNCVKDCRICGDSKPVTCEDSICQYGCECDEGFVRMKKPNGMCIPVEECNNCKNPDFEFKECGSSCRSTCQDILVIRNICPRICEPGCYCKGTKVLDESKNKCVAPEACRKKIN